MKRLTRVLLAVCCVFMDTAALPRVNVWGIAPSLLFALVAAYALAYSVQTGLLYAAVGGLMVDLICNTAIGLTPALYLLALLGLAELKARRTLKRLLLFLAVSALYFAIQFTFAAGASLFGQVRPYGRELLLMQAPGALITGGISAGFYRALKKQYGKKQTN